jgi:hypothetical protein
LKEAILKKNYLKIYLKENSILNTEVLKNEFHLIYKLVKFSKNDLVLKNSKNIYLSSKNIYLKLNYLKCFIDDIDNLFFKFLHFDIIFSFKT